MYLNSEKEIIPDDDILNTLDQMEPDIISGKHLPSSLEGSAIPVRKKESLKFQKVTHSLDEDKDIAKACSSRQAREANTCMDTLQAFKEEEKSISVQQMEEIFHTIFEHHRLGTPLRHSHFRTMKHLSEIYTVYQLGKAVVSGKNENIEWAIGGIGTGLLGSAVTHQIHLFKKSNRLPLQRMASLSPLMGRSISAFPILFSLSQDIKALRHSKTNALPHMLEDSSLLGVEGVLAGAEMLGIETGPAGEVISTFLMIGFDMYESIRNVRAIDQQVHLTALEKLREGIRSFVGLRESGYLAALIERKAHNEAITTQQFELIREASSIDVIIYSLGKTKSTETLVFDGKLEEHMKLTPFASDLSTYFFCTTVKEEHNVFHFADNVIIFNNTEVSNCPANVRTCPFDGRSDRFDFLCLPESEASLSTDTVEEMGYQGEGASRAQASRHVNSQFCFQLKGNFLSRSITRQSLGGYTLPQTKRNFCYNAIILAKKHIHPDDIVLVDLGKDGEKFYDAYKYKPHIFVLSGGTHFIKASKRENTVIIKAAVSGSIKTFQGNNTLYLGLYSETSQEVIVNLDTETLQIGNAILGIQGFNHIVGRTALPDTIFFPRTVEYDQEYFIDGGGGKDNIMPSSASHSEKENSNHISARVNLVLHGEEHVVINENIQSLFIKNEAGSIQISMDPSIDQKNQSAFIPIHLLERSLPDIQNITYHSQPRSLSVTLEKGAAQQDIAIFNYKNGSRLLFITQENYLFYPIMPEIIPTDDNITLNIMEVYLPSNISSTDLLRNISHSLPTRFSVIIRSQQDQQPLTLGSTHHDLLLIPEGNSYSEGNNGNDIYAFLKNQSSAIINNHAKDQAWDLLDFSPLGEKVQLEGLYIYPDLHLSVKNKTDGDEWITVRVLNFTQHDHYRHLQIRTYANKKIQTPIMPALILREHRHPVYFEARSAIHQLEINNLEGISDVTAADIIKYNFCDIQFIRPIFQTHDFVSYYRSNHSLLIYIEDSIFESGLLITQFYETLYPLLTNGSFELTLFFQNEISVTTDQLIKEASEPQNMTTLLFKKHKQHIIHYPIVCCNPITIFHLETENMTYPKIGLLEFNDTRHANADISIYEKDSDLILSVSEKEIISQIITLKEWTSEAHLPIFFKKPENASLHFLSPALESLIHLFSDAHGNTSSSPSLHKNPQRRFALTSAGNSLHGTGTLDFIFSPFSNRFIKGNLPFIKQPKLTPEIFIFSHEPYFCDPFSYRKKMIYKNYQFHALSIIFQYSGSKLLLHTIAGDYWAHILRLDPDWKRQDEVYWCHRLFGLIYQWINCPSPKIQYRAITALLLETIILHRSVQHFYDTCLWPIAQSGVIQINLYYCKIINFFHLSYKPVLINQNLGLRYLKVLTRFLLDIWQFEYHRFSYLPSVLNQLLPDSHQKSFLLSGLRFVLLMDSSSWLLGLGLWLLPQFSIFLEHMGIPVTQKVTDFFDALAQSIIRYALWLNVIERIEENPARLSQSHRDRMLSHQRVLSGRQRLTRLTGSQEKSVNVFGSIA